MQTQQTYVSGTCGKLKMTKFDSFLLTLCMDAYPRVSAVRWLSEAFYWLHTSSQAQEHPNGYVNATTQPEIPGNQILPYDDRHKSSWELLAITLSSEVALCINNNKSSK